MEKKAVCIMVIFILVVMISTMEQMSEVSRLNSEIHDLKIDKMILELKLTNETLLRGTGVK